MTFSGPGEKAWADKKNEKQKQKTNKQTKQTNKNKKQNQKNINKNKNKTTKKYKIKLSNEGRGKDIRNATNIYNFVLFCFSFFVF